MTPEEAKAARARRLLELQNPDSSRYHGGKEVNTTKWRKDRRGPGRRNPVASSSAKKQKIIQKRAGSRTVITPEGKARSYSPPNDALKIKRADAIIDKHKPTKTAKPTKPKLNLKNYARIKELDNKIKQLESKIDASTPKKPVFEKAIEPLSKPNPKLPMYDPAKANSTRGLLEDARAAQRQFNEARAHSANIQGNRELLTDQYKATKAVRSNSAIGRARGLLNRGVEAGFELAGGTRVGKAVGSVAGAFGRTAVGKVAGAILSKTAAPLMVADATYNIAKTAQAGYGAYKAQSDARANENAMTNKYGTVERATATRKARAKK